MEQNKKNIIIGIIVVIIIAVVFIWYFYDSSLISRLPGVFNQEKAGELKEALTSESSTKSAVPKDIKIPEAGEKTSPEIAAPGIVVPAAPGVSSKFRNFDIKAENNTFIPSTIIVGLEDNVEIKFTAVDKPYDVTFPDYGMKLAVKKGETRTMGFQAVLAGKFTYYCDVCGGLDSKAKGFIIVAGQ